MDLQEQRLRIVTLMCATPSGAGNTGRPSRPAVSNDTIVEFGHSINSPVKPLRDVIGDTAASLADHRLNFDSDFSTTEAGARRPSAPCLEKPLRLGNGSVRQSKRDVLSRVVLQKPPPIERLPESRVLPRGNCVNRSKLQPTSGNLTSGTKTAE